MKKQDFLLEIGCEELPADYLVSVLNWYQAGGLPISAGNILTKEGVRWERIETFGTPRRLVMRIGGIPPQVQREHIGPPTERAFDNDGQPTEAAKGFAKRWNVPVSRLKKKQIPGKGLQLVYEEIIPMAKILSWAVPILVRGLRFPKTMRWDESGEKFARPIRWILALYGFRVVKCPFGKLKGGCITFGSRRHGALPQKVSDAASYFQLIKKIGVRLESGWPVVPQPDGAAKSEEKKFVPEKREFLYSVLQEMAEKAGGRLGIETLDENKWPEDFQWLMNTVTFLAEDPVVEVGTFKPNYLDLPSEVLSASMAKNLKLFSIHEKKGDRLLPKFLAVLEGKPTRTEVVAHNIERILEAKFADARFFYREDTRTSLEAKVKELAKVVFHEKLGSVAERLPRLTRLMEAIASQWKGEDRVKKWAPRLAQLCKADLVTQMVREFPSLQGVMGGHYARESGEPEELVTAIQEVYQPRTASDPLPASPLGAIGSLADRIDTLIGFFGVGLKPTGSADPYALRRQATGLVRLLTHPKISFVGLSIDRLFDEGIQSWGSRITADPKILKEQLHAFLRERFEWLALLQRIDREPIAAVLDSDWNDVADAWERLNILHDFWKKTPKAFRPFGELSLAAKVAERTGRIVDSAKGLTIPPQVNPDAFKDSTEKTLWMVWNQVGPEVKDHLRHRRYIDAVRSYSKLYDSIDTFFKVVMVMDEDADVRRNRLALMKEIYQSLATPFANLSRLSPPGADLLKTGESRLHG